MCGGHPGPRLIAAVLGIVVLVGLILISQLLNVSAGIAAVAIITAERMTQTMHECATSSSHNR